MLPSSSAPRPNPVPLFFPSASQQSNHPDLDDMTAEELEMFLDPDADIDEDEAMEDTFSHRDTPQGEGMVDDFDDISLEPTQTRQLDDSKVGLAPLIHIEH